MGSNMQIVYGAFGGPSAYKLIDIIANYPLFCYFIEINNSFFTQTRHILGFNFNSPLSHGVDFSFFVIYALIHPFKIGENTGTEDILIELLGIVHV